MESKTQKFPFELYSIDKKSLLLDDDEAYSYSQLQSLWLNESYEVKAKYHAIYKINKEFYSNESTHLQRCKDLQSQIDQVNKQILQQQAITALIQKPPLIAAKNQKQIISQQSQQLQNEQQVGSQNWQANQIELDLYVCAICLGETKHATQGLLNCKHLFCFDCIFDWSQVTNKCPLCKAPFSVIVKQHPRQIPFVPNNINVDVFIEEVIVSSKEQIPQSQVAVEEIGDLNGCYVCHLNNDFANLLLCDQCNFNCCHMQCMVPAMLVVPIGDWICQYCIAGQNGSMQEAIEMELQSFQPEILNQQQQQSVLSTQQQNQNQQQEGLNNRIETVRSRRRAVRGRNIVDNNQL